jgi:SPP1 family predicted phage head-tail adaptor
MPLTPDAPILDPRLIGHFQRRFFNCDFVLQAPTDAADGQGGKTRTWAGWAGIPATGAGVQGECLGAIHQLSGQEREAMGALGELSTHAIEIAYVAGLDSTLRVTYGARVFDVLSVDDHGEQHLLVGLFVAERFRK